MRYDQDLNLGPFDASLRSAAALLATLTALAVATLVWASGDHGTHCSARDAAPFIDPIVVGWMVAAAVLAVALVILSRRRSVLRGRRAQAGWPSRVIAALTAWTIAVMAAAVFLDAIADLHDPVYAALAGVPMLVVGAVGVATVFLQYFLFVPLPFLVAFSFASRSSNARYRMMQLALSYGLFGCISVAIGSAMLLTGFCGLGD